MSSSSDQKDNFTFLKIVSRSMSLKWDVYISEHTYFLSANIFKISDKSSLKQIAYISETREEKLRTLKSES